MLAADWIREPARTFPKQFCKATTDRLLVDRRFHIEDLLHVLCHAPRVEPVRLFVWHRDSMSDFIPVWPKAQRKLWLQLLEGSFDLIYKDEAAN